MSHSPARGVKINSREDRRLLPRVHEVRQKRSASIADDLLAWSRSHARRTNRLHGVRRMRRPEKTDERLARFGVRPSKLGA